jgi:hypothetical protein
MFKSEKNRGKKVGRGEMDSVMQIVSDILIRGNESRMRLDTLEGHVEIKIDTIIAQVRKEIDNEIDIMHNQIDEETLKTNVQIDGFKKLNFRLNK